MSGKRQETQYSLALNRWIGVKPLSAVAKGPNHSWRNQRPKARFGQNS
jgi:hypothetical protein